MILDGEQMDVEKKMRELTELVAHHSYPVLCGGRAGDSRL